MGGITGEKAALRKELLARRNSLPDREEKSRAIRRAVLALEAWAAAGTILLYLSAGSEPDTWDLLDQAWKQGKAVCAPRCLDGQGRMAFPRGAGSGPLWPVGAGSRPLRSSGGNLPGTVPGAGHRF